MNILDHLTLSQAAIALGYANSSSLSQYCRAGRIPSAIKKGGAWLVSKSWLIKKIKDDRFENSWGALFGTLGFIFMLILLLCYWKQY